EARIHIPGAACGGGTGQAATNRYSSPVSVSTTTLAASAPPSVALVFSVPDVGSTYGSLAWTASQDDGPFLFCEVWLNGAPYANVSTNRSATIPFLNSQTTCTRSMSGQRLWSIHSLPITTKS